MTTTRDHGELVYWAECGVENLDGEMLTAVHEAGHVWALVTRAEPFRYVTMRPCDATLMGRVAVHPLRTSAINHADVALAGPVAEAGYVARHAYDTDQVIPTDEDLVAVALMLAKNGDAAGLRDMDPVTVELLIAASIHMIDKNFDAISDLADQLMNQRTMTRAEATHHLSTRTL